MVRFRAGQKHDAASDAVLEVAHALVQHAFSISLTVASCVHLVDDAAAARLHASIEDLDELIRRIRRFAFGHADVDDRRGDGPTTDTSPASGSPLGTEVTGILDALSASVHRLDALACTDVLDGARSPRLLQSIDRIHVAATALASELVVLLGLLSPDEGGAGTPAG